MGKQGIPASIIAARGRQITLIDGTTPTVVFSFSSVMRLEDEFGSIAGALEALGGVEGSTEVTGKAFTAIAKLLAAGLEHEHVVADEQGHGGGARLSDVETLRYLLDPAQLQDYSTALGEAFEAAFPSKSDDASADEDPTQGATSSPGLTGSTSPLSSSDAQLQSSGA